MLLLYAIKFKVTWDPVLTWCCIKKKKSHRNPKIMNEIQFRSLSLALRKLTGEIPFP